jgi:hypothetical protein
MEHASATVERVERLDVRTEREDVGVELGDGSRFVLFRKHPDFQYLFDRLEADRAAGDVAYVEFDAATKSIKRVGLAFLERIEFVAAEPEDGKLGVIPLRSAAVDFLRADRPRYREWRELLERARRSGQPLLLTRDVATGEIIYVREPLPERSGTKPTPATTP